MSSRASKGVHFGQAPYGYRRMKLNDVVTWAQEPEEAGVVREMFRLATDENLGHKSIADRLTAGVRPHARVGRSLPTPSSTSSPTLRSLARWSTGAGPSLGIPSPRS